MKISRKNNVFGLIFNIQNLDVNGYLLERDAQAYSLIYSACVTRWIIIIFLQINKRRRLILRGVWSVLKTGCSNIPSGGNSFLSGGFLFSSIYINHLN
jgi:hypothetical protein